MKKTYSQLLDEIEQLKERAEEVRRKEVELVIARIRDLITFYGLTEEDLGFRKKVVEKAAAPPPPSAPAPAKAGIQGFRLLLRPEKWKHWIPACAGMTRGSLGMTGGSLGMTGCVFRG